MLIHNHNYCKKNELKNNASTLVVNKCRITPTHIDKYSKIFVTLAKVKYNDK